jgi:hypothetical protein
MAKKKTRKRATNLRWNNDSMEWRDSKGNAQQHPRYAGTPSSLDGKSFMNAYLNSVRKGESLNDFMKTCGKFTAPEVQTAARKLRKAYQDVTAAAGKKDTFPILRVKKAKKADHIGLAVASALVEFGFRKEEDPRIQQLLND